MLVVATNPDLGEQATLCVGDGDVPSGSLPGRVADAFNIRLCTLSRFQIWAKNQCSKLRLLPELCRGGWRWGDTFQPTIRSPTTGRWSPGTIYLRQCVDDDAMDAIRACAQAATSSSWKYQMGAVVEMPNDQIGYLTVLGNEKEGHATAEETVDFRRLAFT